MLNLFGFRATDPRDLHAAVESGVDIVGPENDRVMQAMFAESDLVIAAWGAFPYDGRVTTVMGWERRPDLFCLGYTKNGSPRHPLYVRGDTIPAPFKIGRIK